MVRRIAAPECLGKIHEAYCRHCSNLCPVTALCVLVAMGDYLRQDYKVPPYHEANDSS